MAWVPLRQRRGWVFRPVYQQRTTGEEAGLLTWELGAYGDRVSYTPPSGEAPQVYTDLSFAHFSPSVSVSAQAIHELLHPFARQLALRYGEVLSEWNHSATWKSVELGLFDTRIELLVTGLQQRLFPQPLLAPTVRFTFQEEESAANLWLQGTSELLGSALLHGSDGEERADVIRAALLPALTALSGKCDLSQSGRDRRVTVQESPVFWSIESSIIMRALIEGIQRGLPSLPFERRGESSKASDISQLFSAVYGQEASGMYRLLRDFTDCYPGPEFCARVQALS